jgi:hypothetical protein
VIRIDAIWLATEPMDMRAGTEIGCMAHARRKLFDLHATNKSTLAEQALRYPVAIRNRK